MNAPRSLHASGPTSAGDDTRPQRKRPFYADTADQLRRRAPPIFEGLRLVRRAVTTTVRRHPVGSFAALLVVIAIAIAGWASPPPWRGLIWGTASVLLVTSALLAIAVYAQRVARRHSQLDRRVRSMTDQINRATTSLTTDSKRTRIDLESLQSEIANARTSARRLAHDLRGEADIERSRISSVEIALGTLRKSADDLRRDVAELLKTPLIDGRTSDGGAAASSPEHSQHERAVIEGERAEETHRQNLLSEELLKVEAQLGLLKDVLLRDELAL